MNPEDPRAALPIRIGLLSLGLLLALASPCAADNRTWILEDGSTLLAELKGVSGTGEITLNVQGEGDRHIPFSDLNSSDIDYIRTTGGRSSLPTLGVPQQDVRMFLGFPLGALRGEVHGTVRGRLAFGPETTEHRPDDDANERVWVGTITGSRELWVTRGNEQVAEADMTSLAFRKGRLAHVLIRIPVAPEENGKSAFFEQLRNKLEQLYGLMDQIELGDDVAEAWQAEVGNVHIGLMRRTQPNTVLIISGSYLPLMSGIPPRE